MKIKNKVLTLTMVVLIMAVTGCSDTSIVPVDDKNMIIKTDIGSIVKVPDEKVLSYYESKKLYFSILTDYLLKNEASFHTRPVIIDNVDKVQTIKDQGIKDIAQTIIKEGIVKSIYSLDDEIKDVKYMTGYEYGVYEQGLRYVSRSTLIDAERTRYNYVREYKELGDGWYYFLYYYDHIKDEDEYRKIGWDKLTDAEKKSVTYDVSKAIVSLEQWKNVALQLDKEERDLVVSVCFNTNMDGFLGPIVMYFDPETKELIGHKI